MHNFSNSDFAQISLSLKLLSMDMVQKAKSGHPGMPMGMADITAVLVSKYLKFNSQNPAWVRRDRFILSNGHGSALQYSMLHLLGYKAFDLKQLKNFRQLGSNTHGHPELLNYKKINGIETTTGPLGQGIANAVGMAIALKKLAAQYPEINLDNKVYCYCGDGCMMEGITQEAISLAGHLGLDNLILIYDNNKISIDGSIELALSDNINLRFKASNWEVISIDGHNYDEINHAFNASFSNKISKPVLIDSITKIAHGASTKEGSSSAHGAPLGEDEIKEFKLANGLKNQPFHITDKAKKLWKKISENADSNYQKWIKNNHISTEGLHKELEDKIYSQILPALRDAAARLIRNEGEKAEEATRKSSKYALDIISSSIGGELMMFGSSDLTDSNCIRIENYQPITKHSRVGNFIHYGVREHAMAGIMNGIALSGCFMPFGASFLAFIDYMKPALRLSCIMNLKVIYVMTHDSIALGEDGSTHQPIEHLPSLRMVPNLRVLRPCDAVETLVAYDIALRCNGPSVLVFSRQKLPQILQDDNFESYYEFGAKLIYTNSQGLDVEGIAKKYDVMIFATGSEVSLAMEVAKDLVNHDVKAAVISVLDFNKFLNNHAQFEVQILKGKPALKVAIEAAIEGLWSKIIGEKGLFFGLNSFGASGKYEDLYKHFGLDAKKIAGQIEDAISFI